MSIEPYEPNCFLCRAEAGKSSVGIPKDALCYAHALVQVMSLQVDLAACEAAFEKERLGWSKTVGEWKTRAERAETLLREVVKHAKECYGPKGSLDALLARIEEV